MIRPTRHHRAVRLFALVLLATPAAAQAPRRLALGDVVRLALEQNAAVEVARARVDAAENRQRQRRADLLPNVSASALRLGREFNTATLGFQFKSPTGASFFNPRGQVEGPVNTVDLRARISQQLFDPAAFARVRSASAATRSAAFEIDGAGEAAAAAAALAAIRALRAAAQLDARLADSLLAEELLVVAQDQLRAGVGIALDVTRAQSQRATIRAQVIGARAERDRALLDVQRVLSIPASETVSLADSLAGLAMADDAQSGPPAQRGDIRTLDSQRDAADRALSAIRAERLPSLSAFADYGPIQGAGGAYLPTYTFGLQLSVPVFDGWRREGRLGEQGAQRAEIEIRRRDLVAQQALDLRAAELDAASAREQLAATRERRTLAEQEVAQARDRFRAGVSGNSDVIAATLSLNQARTLVVDALAAYHTARITKARAAGTIRTLY